MIFPGANVLGIALTVIGSGPVNYYAYQSTAVGPTGKETATYAAAQLVLKGSVQPVDRSRYNSYGLDFQKSYITWFVPNVNAQSIRRNPDGSGDVIEFPVNNDGSLIAGVSRRYQLIGDTPWMLEDGWNRVLGVDIGPATGSTKNA